MSTPHPFDDSSFQVGGLTVDSATDKVAIYGSLDLTRDGTGLAKARHLQAYLARVIEVLEATERAGQLPPSVPVETPTRRANPLEG